jgi:AAA domain
VTLDPELRAIVADRRRLMPRHSWEPVDLLTIESTSSPPTIGGLLYPGKRHVLVGEPDAGKSWLAIALCVAEIEKGNVAVYIDADGNGGDVMLERLRALGLSDGQVRSCVHFLRPDEPMLDPTILADVEQMLREEPPVTLVVGDSMDALLYLHSLDPNSTIECERFYHEVVDRWIAHGAAALLLDHGVKNREQRGRFAIGSQRKTGRAEVVLGLEIATPFKRGERGVARLVTHKDRPGYHARPKLGELELTSDPESGRVTWAIRPASEQEGVPFRPTFLMGRISEYVEAHLPEEELTVGQTLKAVKGKDAAKRRAIELLVEDGYLEERSGSRNARLITSLRPYREEDDDLA